MYMFLWIGSALGAALGVLHGFSLYREMAARSATTGATAGTKGSAGRALYYGLWTFILWTVLGSYVFAFWLIGGVARSLAGVKR